MGERSCTVSVKLIDIDDNSVIYEVPKLQGSELNETINIHFEELLNAETIDEILQPIIKGISFWQLDCLLAGIEYDPEEPLYAKYLDDYRINSEKFISNVKRTVKSPRDISEIDFIKKYVVRTDGYDLNITDDKQLHILAENFLKSKSNVSEKALTDYLNSSNGNRCCGSFGEGYDDFRYKWSGNADDLTTIANYVVRGKDKDDIIIGREVQIVSFKTQHISRYAEIEIQVPDEPVPAWQKKYSNAMRHMQKEFEQFTDEQLIAEYGDLIEDSQNTIDRDRLAKAYCVEVLGLKEPIKRAKKESPKIIYDESEFYIKGKEMVGYRGNSDEVFIPEGITSIGWPGFDRSAVVQWERNSAKIIHIPASVKKISGLSFRTLIDLEKIIVDENSRHYKSEDGCL